MIFPVDTILGQLEMITEYEYYDCPRLFSCKNKENKKYIGLSVKDENDYQIWMYVFISDNRLKEVDMGKIDIRDIFVNSEDCYVYIVSTHNILFDSVTQILSQCIPEEYLPYKGQILPPKEEVMNKSVLKWTFKIISIVASIAAVCLWALSLFGMCVGRHLDDGGFAMGRVRLFALCGLCTLIVGVIFNLIVDSMEGN